MSDFDSIDQFHDIIDNSLPVVVSEVHWVI